MEAVLSLLEVLGILRDHDWAGVGAGEALRADALESRLHAMWSPGEWDDRRGPDRIVDFEIEDASLLLGGLSFTEMMSVDLPWIDMVRWTVDFMTEQLRPLWSEEEWAQLGAG